MGSFGATENNENRPLYLAKSRFFSGMGASQPRASYSDSPGLVPWPKMLPRAPPRAWAIRRHPQSRWARSWVTANYRLRRLWSLLYRRFGSKIVPHPHVKTTSAPPLACARIARAWEKFTVPGGCTGPRNAGAAAPGAHPSFARRKQPKRVAPRSTLSEPRRAW